MYNEETIYCLALRDIKNVGLIIAKRLMEKFGSAKAIFESDIEKILSVDGVTLDKAKNIKNFNNWQNIEKIVKRCQKENIKIYSFTDPEYPHLLKEISDPPVTLFCIGSILPQDHFGIAIVGSRRPTNYGIRVTETLSNEIASYGITIISGLARGIDSIAHNSALNSGGRTIAVLGSGVSHIYPPENKKLANRIIQNGAIISEFYPDDKPLRENFPRRNRIISGMSIGTIVTEAGVNSGALITASFAVDQGREVFAVPGNINSENSKGTNFLIKKGAKLVQTVEDILEEIRQFIPSLNESMFKKTGEKLIELKDEEKVIFHILKEPNSIDEIVYKTGKSISEILTTLLNLEIKGLILKSEGKYVRRNFYETS